MDAKENTFVSPEAFIGTMYWGTRVAESMAHRVIGHALSNGPAFLDTANNYAFWLGSATGDESELVIGSWIAKHPESVADGSLRIASKAGARPVAQGGDLSNIMDLKPESIRDQLHGSLSRLNVERIDLYYAHIYSRTVPQSEVIGTLQDLVSEGLIAHYGVSNYTSTQLPEVLDFTGNQLSPVSIQNYFTYLQPKNFTPYLQDLMTEEVISTAQDHGITRAGYSPLLSGAYDAKGKDFPDMYEASAIETPLSALRRIAQEYGLASGQVVLSWATHRHRSVTPIVGISSPEQFDSMSHAIKTDLPEAVYLALDAAR
ncbi:aldo/keto reductase [Haematomicrobium sanguinis]|uniref:aldo/keto reductase n=1 Tax=Haematomicrobium sanguinis TaxID=479106 RepID=UPI0006911259|nr:aldo/keto reductase [Haematomicrobium sanguinis]